MSGVDVYEVLEAVRKIWGHLPVADLVLTECVAAMRAAEERGYLGALYRTDYEVSGSGAFPVDMLRYTCSWPRGETDAQAIEDSLDDVVREAPRRGPAVPPRSRAEPRGRSLAGEVPVARRPGDRDGPHLTRRVHG